MDLEMTIEQADNGWIVTYCGHDGLEKTILCRKWVEVYKELDDYFGWWGADGKLSKSAK